MTCLGRMHSEFISEGFMVSWLHGLHAAWVAAAFELPFAVGILRRRCWHVAAVGLVFRLFGTLWHRSIFAVSSQEEKGTTLQDIGIHRPLLLQFDFWRMFASAIQSFPMM